LAPSARRALHARLAATLTDPEERARQLVLAADGPDAEVAAAVERGADRARQRGAPEVAAELAEAAVRLTPDDQVEQVRRRRVAAGYHRLAAGDVRQGRAHLALALQGVPPGPVRADLRWRLAVLTLTGGDLGGAVELLQGALAESGGDRALQALVCRRLGGMYWWQGRFREALRLMRQALDLAEALGDAEAQVDALTFYVLAALYAGELPADLPARVERLAGATAPRQPHEDPQLGLAAADLARGDAAAAAARLERVHRRAAELGDEPGLVWAPSFLAEVELARGRWPLARRLAGEALRTARRLDSPLVLARGLLGVALVDAHLGGAAADKAALELLGVAERGGLVPFELEGRAVLGFVALSRGDARAAHAELGPLLERIADMGLREPTWARLAWSELDALVELGRLDQAAELAAELEARGRALRRPSALATALRAGALVDAARGEQDAALAGFGRALAEHDRLGWPFEEARTLLALGVVLRRGKRKQAARQALDRALALFDGLGAALWAARASAELARIGGRAPGAGGLTPSERRVADLVAQGHTNQEVAGLLFLSAKTVAAHLTSVYAKLGVRSRTELAHRLGGGPDATGR
ncbi:MAG TPA: helix-turn-helix transcriptional regulator, partial [Actinomycetes bacterium]